MSELDLPGDPPPVLRDAYGPMAVPYKEAVLDHLLGGTSADWLSGWFKRYGTPVGSTTIKTYRASLRETGVCK